LIPGYNDSEENLRKTAEFMVANNLKYIDLLAYHSFAENKYKKLGRKFETAGVKEPSKEEMEKL
jgi:pyruvate-formate lyase-activating enzyme